VLFRRKHLLASAGTLKLSDDAAIAIAQTALRIGTCDQRSTPLPEGFLSSDVNHRSTKRLFNFLYASNI
jgi:hypothetical protein